jgi:hypothetical protein
MVAMMLRGLGESETTINARRIGRNKQCKTTPLVTLSAIPLSSMASSALSGVRSPASPRSGATSPRPSKFDSDQLKTYIKKLLASTLQNVTWPEFKERERGRALMKEVGDRVKERMLGTLVTSVCPSEAREAEPFIEIEPRGLWVAFVSNQRETRLTVSPKQIYCTNPS